MAGARLARRTVLHGLAAAPPAPCAAPPAERAVSDRLDWARDGRDWPNRAASRFVAAGGITWHVQVMGAGPAIVLLHGTGASTHSWRGLAPLLARRFTVVAPDLPGHGFTDTPPAALLSLPGMAGAVAALLGALGLTPAMAAGHSAGAAVLARMCIDRLIAPAALVSLNGALLPLHGMAGVVFSALARTFVTLPLVPSFFAWRARDEAAVARLLRDTGSTLDAEGVALYARLFRSPAHVAATLGMMAAWDLDALAADLSRLRTPLLLVAARNDLTVSPSVARRVAAMVPGARIVHLAGLGHLAHEEQPEAVAAIIAEAAGPGGDPAAPAGAAP